MFDSQRLRVQREATPTPARRPAPSVAEERRQPFEPGVRIASESAFGHDFSAVRVHADQSAAEPARRVGAPACTVGSDVSTCNGNEEQSQQGRPGGGGQQGAQGQVKPPTCPSKAVIETVTDLTPAGIKKGWRTGYGALALVRVEPTTTDWDGTSIVEQNKETSSTCPKEFEISPCAGASTFPVGSAAHSGVLGDLPAVKNHFYDTHMTRWNMGSLLHDPARNPHGLSSCEAVCEQKYVCGGTVISTQTVKRVFTKGKDGSRDVTLVNVTIT
jgi:Domain of unknown function (DUF4157)